MRVFITIALILAPITAYMANAQDVIVMRSGVVVNAKVQEVTSSEIKYKKSSNLNGPLYTVNKSEVFAINYENGEVENCATQKAEATAKVQSQETAATNSLPIVTAKPADASNANLLLQYNRDIVPVKSQKAKKGTIWNLRQYVSYGITNGSIISNEDIEVLFERAVYIDKYFNSYYVYNIKVKNKTTETIYIDLAKSTRTETDGSYRVYYDPSKITTTTTGIASAGAVHFGLVSVGGGTSGSASTIHNPKAQVILPAKSTGYFSEHTLKALHFQTYIWQPRSKFELVSEGEYLANEKISERAHIGEVVTFTEENSPYKLNYKICYAKGDDTKNLYTMDFTLFVHQLFGYHKWKHIFGSTEEPNNLIIMKRWRSKDSMEGIPSVGTIEYE